MWMSSLCRLPMVKNHNLGQILTFWGFLCRPPFTDEGQIWCAIADPWSTLTRQISFLFGPCLLWPRSPISATAELLSTFPSMPWSNFVQYDCVRAYFRSRRRVTDGDLTLTWRSADYLTSHLLRILFDLLVFFLNWKVSLDVTFCRPM